MGVALASQLREGTQAAHSAAESSSFVKYFVRGLVGRDLYRKHLADLYFVYCAMEEKLSELAHHPVLSLIQFPELRRRASIEADLGFYYGPDWQKQVKSSPAGERYVKHIEDTAAQNPELLVAHSYTRYLGDLSGGQILKKVAKKAMKLNDSEGLRFYEFSEIEDGASFKQKYRQTLNELPLDQPRADRIVEEANTVFKLNMELFQEWEGELDVTALEAAKSSSSVP